MSHFLVNNVAILPIIFLPINGRTSTTTKMLEGTDDLGAVFEHFNTSNTTAIMNLYKHITPTTMIVGTQYLKDLLVPIFEDLSGTFNTGSFEIPPWCSKMVFLLIGGGGGGGGFSYYLVNVVYGVSTGTFNIGYGGAGSSSTNINGSNGNNTFIYYNGMTYMANGGGGGLITGSNSGGWSGSGNHRDGNFGDYGDNNITYVVNSQLKLVLNGVVNDRISINNDEYHSGDVVGGRGGYGGGSGLSNYTF